MLAISNRPVYYTGQYRQQAVDLIRSGVRVGMMWLSGEPQVHCHVCGKDFCPPVLGADKDAFSPCPHCHTPFVFAAI